MESIEIAYKKFKSGSKGFCKYVESHSGMGMSRMEIECIARTAPNASAFLRIWNDEIYWKDKESGL